MDRKFDLLHFSSDKTISNLYTMRTATDTWMMAPMPTECGREIERKKKFKKGGRKRNTQNLNSSMKMWPLTTTMFYFNHSILSALMVRQNLSSPDKRILCSLSVWFRCDAFNLLFLSSHHCAQFLFAFLSLLRMLTPDTNIRTHVHEHIIADLLLHWKLWMNPICFVSNFRYLLHYTQWG